MFHRTNTPRNLTVLEGELHRILRVDEDQRDSTVVMSELRVALLSSRDPFRILATLDKAFMSMLQRSRCAFDLELSALIDLYSLLHGHGSIKATFEHLKAAVSMSGERHHVVRHLLRMHSFTRDELGEVIDIVKESDGHAELIEMLESRKPGRVELR